MYIGELVKYVCLLWQKKCSCHADPNTSISKLTVGLRSVVRDLFVVDWSVRLRPVVRDLFVVDWSVRLRSVVRGLFVVDWSVRLRLVVRGLFVVLDWSVRLRLVVIRGLFVVEWWTGIIDWLCLQAVDWWSLGVLTYELLTGASPFTVDGESNTQSEISRYNLLIVI